MRFLVVSNGRALERHWLLTVALNACSPHGWGLQCHFRRWLRVPRLSRESE
ncbi:hypothetical protein PR003_g12299 [Phytophthora rubi]|uniref:Uncharacterized protein n=1 Tax=Phytophthora rubi TaxID=129364 RepID=A0A6A3LUH7_9STRA|nr:hypothetical protein PR002_g11748 [Phytophthora rubi]KAE9050296.1 hypothetical protein PR001_g2503 [Phytophthora rubi]KAE9336853.1 hypothetical protein PR003_g12299 [Phytophthora rubi]